MNKFSNKLSKNIYNGNSLINMKNAEISVFNNIIDMNGLDAHILDTRRGNTAIFVASEDSSYESYLGGNLHQRNGHKVILDPNGMYVDTHGPLLKEETLSSQLGAHYRNIRRIDLRTHTEIKLQNTIINTSIEDLCSSEPTHFFVVYDTSDKDMIKRAVEILNSLLMILSAYDNRHIESLHTQIIIPHFDMIDEVDSIAYYLKEDINLNMSFLLGIDNAQNLLSDYILDLIEHVGVITIMTPVIENIIPVLIDIAESTIGDISISNIKQKDTVITFMNDRMVLKDKYYKSFTNREVIERKSDE